MLLTCEGAPATDAHVIAEARRRLSAKVRRGSAVLDGAEKVRDFLAVTLGDLQHEVFSVLLLDNRHRLIEYRELFRGTIDGTAVYPREVVRLCVEKGAAAVIFAHPHPSGVAEPSQADELITRRLRDALALIDVRVLDHMIVAGGEVVSFAARGLL